MNISELSVRTIKATDYFIVETEGEATARVLFNAAQLGLASASELSTLDGKVDQQKTDLQQQITSAIATVYTVKGSTTFDELPAVAEASVGWVYNVTDSFETTEDFVEGTGKKYPEHTNIVCTNYSDGNKWDVLGPNFDLTNYVTKDQISTDEATLQQLQTAVAKLQTDVAAAQAAADLAKQNAATAQSAAEGAQSTADGAQTAAETAQTAAETAQGAAEAAQADATQAKTDAATAQSAAEKAQGDIDAFKAEAKNNYIEVKHEEV